MTGQQAVGLVKGRHKFFFQVLRFLEFQDREHLSRVLQSQCLPTFTLKESLRSILLTSTMILGKPPGRFNFQESATRSTPQRLAKSTDRIHWERLNVNSFEQEWNSLVNYLYRSIKVEFCPFGSHG